MKEQIQKLRAEGKKYLEIKSIVGCSLSTICYYLRSDQKRKIQNRKNKLRYNKKTVYKNKLGGKCQICGYDKCQNALHFHHINPEEKKFTISDAGSRKSFTKEEIDAEIKKCVLVCANCHAEIHAGLIKLESGASPETSTLL